MGLSWLVGGGSVPPERKEGQRERSSGRDVPVADDGERWDKMAAAGCSTSESLLEWENDDEPRAIGLAGACSRQTWMPHANEECVPIGV